MKKNSKGIVMIILVIVMALGLIIITSIMSSRVSYSNIIFNQKESEEVYYIAQSVLNDGILKFLRYREVLNNPYSSWASNCLDINKAWCKMETSLDASGGTIDVWGKMRNKTRHLQATLIVEADQAVTITKEELE